MFDSYFITAMAVVGGPLVVLGAIVFASIGLRAWLGPIRYDW